MRAPLALLASSLLLPALAACGGGGGGGGGGDPEPSVIRRMGLVQTPTTKLGTSSCTGRFTGDDTEQLLAVGCEGTAATVCDTGWSIYRVDPFGSEKVAPVEIPAMPAIRSALTLFPGGPQIVTFDGDQDGYDDLVLAVPASGAIFVVFEPLSAAASVAGPFILADGPAAPRYGRMVLRVARANANAAPTDAECVVIGMPDAGRGRGQVAIVVSAATRAAFGAANVSAPWVPAGLDATAAFGSAVDGYESYPGSFDVVVGAPGEGGGTGAVHRLQWQLRSSAPSVVETLTPPTELGARPGYGSAIALPCGSLFVAKYSSLCRPSVAIGAPGAYLGEGAVVIRLTELSIDRIHRSPAPGRGFGAELEVVDIEGDGDEAVLVTQPNCEPDGSGAVGMRINWDIKGMSRLEYELGSLRRLSEAPTGATSTISARRQGAASVSRRADFIAWYEGATDGAGVLAIRDLADKRRIDFTR